MRRKSVRGPHLYKYGIGAEMDGWGVGGGSPVVSTVGRIDYTYDTAINLEVHFPKKIIVSLIMVGMVVVLLVMYHR